VIFPDRSERIQAFCDVPVPIILMDNVWNHPALVCQPPGSIEQNPLFEAEGENRTGVVGIDFDLR
jgi:hypothetical protein